MIPSSGRRSFAVRIAEAHTVLPSFEEAVREGLDQPSGDRRIPCRFLYDEKGSQLFEQICELDEYYPTRAELSILEENADEIVDDLAPGQPFVELGSGSERKIRPLLQAAIRRHGRAHYIPIDISPTILEESALRIREEFGDELEVTVIVGEYRDALREFAKLDFDDPLGLWLGGSIGNMEREGAGAFLAEVREVLGHVVIGIDLRKSRDVLLPAYADSEGVTAEFTLNVLSRISRELGAAFDDAQFEHVVDYDDETGAVEIELESQSAHTVRVDGLGLEISFEKGERIHVENSIKYSEQEIDALAAAAGYELEKRWLDREGLFSLNRLGPAS